jgi:hypothetical protein
VAEEIIKNEGTATARSLDVSNEASYKTLIDFAVSNTPHQKCSRGSSFSIKFALRDA